MDGQGDGDHNGPNRHHIHIPTEDQPPNGDNNDMEFIFLLHFIINHHMRVFRQNQIGFVNENIVNVHIENHADHFNHIIEENEENEDDDDFADEVQIEVNQEEEEEEEEEDEEEPQPGPSRNYSRDDAEQEEGTRIRKRSWWWHEFEYTSDSSLDLDNDEELLLGRSKERLRDEIDSEDIKSLESVHELASCADLAEEGEGTKESQDLSEQEAKKTAVPGTSRLCLTEKAGHLSETKGEKYFQWWHGVEDNSSDSGTDLDVEENSLPCPSETKSRDESVEEKGENDLQDVSSMPNCVHRLAQSIMETAMTEGGQASVEDVRCSAQEAEEHPEPDQRTRGWMDLDGS
ncbi:uncharacterized protein ACBT44_006319 isoform 2-T2 [Syngnathus typhle]